jgi:iron complex outermembrane receptor protein
MMAHPSDLLQAYFYISPRASKQGNPPAIKSVHQAARQAVPYRLTISARIMRGANERSRSRACSAFLLQGVYQGRMNKSLSGPVIYAMIAALSVMSTPAFAQASMPALSEQGNLNPVVVSSTRIGVSPFATPASVNVVEGAAMRNSLPQINLSESLGSVPGLLIQNRQNYAQDLQISIRGFGARSTFGIRGVRLYVDGIPATMPDGQGQSSNIDITSIERIEVLRGPFSALYGNSSGGVIQIFTEDGNGAPTVTPDVTFGSYDSRRYAIKAAGSTDIIDYLLSVSRFTTDGYREHSAANKNLVNGKLGIRLADESKLTLVINGVDLKAQDPLGLDATQFKTNPRSAAAVAEQFNTRKTVQQTQGGLVYERRIDHENDLRVMAYYGKRDTLQFQAIPPAPQSDPRHAGGVIALTRDYAGIDTRWTSRLQLAARPLTLIAGLAYDTLDEQRQGYENFIDTGSVRQLGVQGRLRRDEDNKVWNIDPYLQASWKFTERWTLDAGVRHSTVHFSSNDRYIVGLNGDDSGAARYGKTLPVAALRYLATPDLSLYMAAGRGFETPTLNEISYRSDGLPGLNFALQPSINTSVELGAKAKYGHGMVTAAVFQTRTDDEIVSAGSSVGRATFLNAGRTLRNGLEVAWQGEFARNWRTQAAYTYLEATYRDGFGGVPAGNRIPGIPQHMAFASLGWEPPQAWRGGMEGRCVSKIYVNDSNAEAAPGYCTVGIHIGYVLQRERWTTDVFARLDNLFDRQYAGSIIINEANGRNYEPAPGRNWSMGLRAVYRF